LKTRTAVGVDNGGNIGLIAPMAGNGSIVENGPSLPTGIDTMCEGLAAPATTNCGASLADDFRAAKTANVAKALSSTGASAGNGGNADDATVVATGNGADTPGAPFVAPNFTSEDLAAPTTANGGGTSDDFRVAKTANVAEDDEAEAADAVTANSSPKNNTPTANADPVVAPAVTGRSEASDVSKVQARTFARPTSFDSSPRLANDTNIKATDVNATTMAPGNGGNSRLADAPRGDNGAMPTGADATGDISIESIGEDVAGDGANTFHAGAKGGGANVSTTSETSNRESKANIAREAGVEAKPSFSARVVTHVASTVGTGLGLPVECN